MHSIFFNFVFGTKYAEFLLNKNLSSMTAAFFPQKLCLQNKDTLYLGASYILRKYFISLLAICHISFSLCLSLLKLLINCFLGVRPYHGVTADGVLELLDELCHVYNVWMCQMFLSLNHRWHPHQRTKYEYKDPLKKLAITKSFWFVANTTNLAFLFVFYASLEATILKHPICLKKK